MAKYKGPWIRIRDTASEEEFDLVPEVMAIALPATIHPTCSAVTLDRKTGKVHFQNKKNKAASEAVCSWSLAEWENDEACFVEGEPGQKDKEGRQIFWRSTVVGLVEA